MIDDFSLSLMETEASRHMSKTTASVIVHLYICSRSLMPREREREWGEQKNKHSILSLESLLVSNDENIIVCISFFSLLIHLKCFQKRLELLYLCVGR